MILLSINKETMKNMKDKGFFLFYLTSYSPEINPTKKSMTHNERQMDKT